MTDYPLHLLGLILIALWFRARPRYSLKALGLFWWLGLITVRIAPSVVMKLAGAGKPPESASALGLFLGLMLWIGSLFYLRAIIGFAVWNRPWRRRTWVYFGGLVAFLLGSAALHEPRGLGLALLAIPFLLSVRWRNDMGALGLLLANLTAICTILISIVQIRDPDAYAGATAKGLVHLSNEVGVLGVFYAFSVLPTTATRIHLRIRRIGRRLVSSHLLAGLIPAGLLVLFLLLGTTLYLSTYRGTLAVRSLTEMSRKGALHLARDLDPSGSVSGNPLPGGSAGLLLVKRGTEPARVQEGSPSFNPDSLLASNEPSSKTPLLFDGKTLFLRARLDTVLAGSPLHIEALAPVDSMRMAEVSRVIGIPVRINPRVQVSRAGGGVTIGGDDETDESEDGSEAESTGIVGSTGNTSAGVKADARSIGPANIGRWQLPGGATISALRLKDGAWQPSTIIVTSSAGFGEQILSLFSVSHDNPMAIVVLIVLGLIAIFFLSAIWVTTAMVISMGRSVAQSAGALSAATEALREGKMEHRIEIKGNDELWEVAGSFNLMAEELGKMREVELESQRLEEELRLARVIQNRLLPAFPPILERAELAGMSLPAREVGGDYFDYLILEGGLIGIAVADVSGKGAPAAMLMSTFRASLRSQDLQLLGPAEVMGRINRFIHSSVDTGKFITAFLGLLNPATGEFKYSNAGHDAPLVIAPDGSVSELTGGGLILGLLPQIVYENATAQLPPGSLVAIFTDGVTEARDPSGAFFGSEGLLEALKSDGQVPCDALLHRVVDSIQRFSASGPQSDDITLVLIRRR